MSLVSPVSLFKYIGDYSIAVASMLLAVITAVLAQFIAAAPSPQDATLVQRDGNCASQPAGAGPVPSPDAAEVFRADPNLQVCLDVKFPSSMSLIC